MKDVEVCYHLAARASHRLCMPYPREYFLTDALGTENVAEAARLADVESVVFTSSGSVYGSQQIPWVEKNQVSPNGPYGFAKVVAEGIGKLYFKWYGINWKSIRCFNVVGPRCREDTVVTLFYNHIVNHQPPIVFNRRGNTEGLRIVRDFTHVADIVNGLILASRFTPKSPEEIIFNMSAGYQTSILELAEMMIEMLEMKGKLKPNSGMLQDHEPLSMMADSSKAEKLLGWGKRLPPKETIQQYIHWRQLNPSS
jgi:nucleoside-diphosphate-sugar epimerase